MDKNTMYYIHVNDKELGPLNFNQLIDNGLTDDTLVWWQGAANWFKASEVPELQPLLQSVTPQPVTPSDAAPLQSTAGQRPTIYCPYCGEEILAVARKCRYCGEWLQPADATSTPSQLEPLTGLPTTTGPGGVSPVSQPVGALEPSYDSFPPMMPSIPVQVPSVPAAGMTQFQSYGAAVPSQPKKSRKGVYALVGVAAALLLIIVGVVIYNSVAGKELTSDNVDEWMETSNEAVLTEFTILGGFNSTTGNNYKAFDYDKVTGFKFDISGEGEEVDVTATCTLSRSEVPAEEINGNTEIWINFYEKNAKGIYEMVAKLELVSTPESQEMIAECIEKGKPGDTVELVAKAKAKKADLQKMNGQKTNNTLVCR